MLCIINDYSCITENSLGDLGEVDTRYWKGNLSVEYTL